MGLSDGRAAAVKSLRRIIWASGEQRRTDLREIGERRSIMIFSLLKDSMERSGAGLKGRIRSVCVASR